MRSLYVDNRDPRDWASMHKIENCKGLKLAPSGKALQVEMPGTAVTEKKVFPVTAARITMWVPISQIGTESDVLRAGDSGDLLVSKWWGSKQGLCKP